VLSILGYAALVAWGYLAQHESFPYVIVNPAAIGFLLAMLTAEALMYLDYRRRKKDGVEHDPPQSSASAP
jgi:uncharacterized membrane protein